MHALCMRMRVHAHQPVDVDRAQHAPVQPAALGLKAEGPQLRLLRLRLLVMVVAVVAAVALVLVTLLPQQLAVERVLRRRRAWSAAAAAAAIDACCDVEPRRGRTVTAAAAVAAYAACQVRLRAIHRCVGSFLEGRACCRTVAACLTGAAARSPPRSPAPLPRRWPVRKSVDQNIMAITAFFLAAWYGSGLQHELA